METPDTSNIITELPKTVETVSDLLSAPLFVLTPKAASNPNVKLSVTWIQKKMTVVDDEPDENGYLQRGVKREYKDVERTFTFSRSKEDKGGEDEGAYPTIEHANYLHILLCLFVKNRTKNKSNKLYFRFRDVLIAAGKNPTSTTRSIKAAITRYQSCTTIWITNLGHRKLDQRYSIITESSVLDHDNEIIKGKEATNPRRSNNKKEWHWVKFSDKVVKLIDENIGRFLLTETFKFLKPSTASVYRYYYGYPDARIDTITGKKQPVHHFRSLEQLHKIFNWTGQKNRFKPWLEARFAELLKHNLIDKPFWTSETSVRIRCKNHTEVTEKKQLIESPTQGKLDLNNTTDETLLAEYIRLKSEKIIPEASCIAIDMVISVPALKSNAFPMIKKLILEHTQQQP